jgi:ABC-type molybdate transport system substrate-binding protein
LPIFYNRADIPHLIKGLIMSLTSIRRRLLLALLWGFLVTPFMISAGYAADITVFAAASLKNALDDVAKAYESMTGDKVVISYAASSMLAKQVPSWQHACADSAKGLNGIPPN